MTVAEGPLVPGADGPRRLSRRDILRRGAVVGGTAAAVWAAPQLTTRALAAASCGSSPCFCGVYTLNGMSAGSWLGGVCNGGATLPTQCGGTLNTGLPAGYSFTISTTATTVDVTLVKDDSSQCGWEFEEAWIYLDCDTPACKQATLSGSPCKRTATFTYTGSLPTDIETCFRMYFRLCGCADS